MIIGKEEFWMEDLALKLSERESLYQLYLYAFNRQDSPARKAFFMDRVEHGKVFRVKDGEQVVSGLYRLPFELRISDQLFKMGGIGDVMTYPEYGGHGYATTLLKTALADMNADGYELSFLAPFSQRYYRRLGYEQAVSVFTYEIDSQKFRPVKVKAQRKIERTLLANSVNEIAEYYRRAVATQDGKIDRQRWWWHYLTLKNNWNVAKVYDSTKMSGYAIYEIQGMNLIVSEINYQDGNTYQTLLNFIAAHSSMVERFVFKDYSNFYQGYYSLEPNIMGVHVEPYMMGRIVNFKRFITKYPFENEFGMVSIKIEDDVLQSNNGVWRVSKEGIEQGSQKDHWQIQGKINDLSAFFLGQIPLKQAIQLHRIQTQAIDENQLARLDSAVKKNVLRFNDYF